MLKIGKLIASILLVVSLVGCGSGENGATVVNVDINNSTSVKKPTPPTENDQVIPVDGLGTIDKPFIIRQNGTFDINESGFYKTNYLESNCTTTVISFNKYVYSVNAMDEMYESQDVNTTTNRFIFTPNKGGMYILHIETYGPDKFSFFAECWK